MVATVASITAVKNLYLSKELSPGIAGALQDLVGGRLTEVLPGLQNTFVEWLEPSGHFQENIGISGSSWLRDSVPTLSPSLSGTKALPRLSQRQCDVARKLQHIHSCFHIHLVSLLPRLLLLNSPSLLLLHFSLSSVYHTLYHALSDTSMHLHAYVPPVSSYTLFSVECFR